MDLEPNAPGIVNGADRSWAGWLLMDPERVPRAWRGRVVSLSLVPLLPEEQDQILTEGRALSRIPEEDLPILRSVAAGTPVTSIARETGLHLRTVQRRVAGYCRRFGVRTTAELAAVLARRGF